jgi:CheY-like chemotaxis protein
VNTPSPPRLLLVEDDPDNLEVVSILLSEKYAVFGYGSGVEALEAVDTAKPQVLVLDIRMRPMDGIQCLHAIRSIPDYRHVPAVALTALARDVERQQFLDGGFQAVVVKPILDPAQLMIVIDRMLKSPLPVGSCAALRQRPQGPDGPSAAAMQLDGREARPASYARGSGTQGRRGPA